MPFTSRCKWNDKRLRQDSAHLVGLAPQPDAPRGFRILHDLQQSLANDSTSHEVDTIQIECGGWPKCEPLHWFISKKLLMDHSVTFRTQPLLDVESVVLKGVDPAIFELFVKFLYTGEVKMQSHDVTFDACDDFGLSVDNPAQRSITVLGVPGSANDLPQASAPPSLDEFPLFSSSPGPKEKTSSMRVAPPLFPCWLKAFAHGLILAEHLKAFEFHNHLMQKLLSYLSMRDIGPGAQFEEPHVKDLPIAMARLACLSGGPNAETGWGSWHTDIRPFALLFIHEISRRRMERMNKDLKLHGQIQIQPVDEQAWFTFFEEECGAPIRDIWRVESVPRQVIPDMYTNTIFFLAKETDFPTFSHEEGLIGKVTKRYD